jgi:hypothetical protein
VYLIYDEDTEKENIDFAQKYGIETIKVVNIKDSGFSKVKTAFEHCKNKYCAILQDDDYFNPIRLMFIYEILQKVDQEYALIKTTTFMMRNGIVLGLQGPKEKCLTPPSTWIINKEIVKTIDDYEILLPLKWGWDKALALQFGQKGDVLWIDRPLSYYTYSDEQATNDFSDEYKQWCDKEIEKYAKNFKKINIDVVN